MTHSASGFSILALFIWFVLAAAFAFEAGAVRARLQALRELERRRRPS